MHTQPLCMWTKTIFLIIPTCQKINFQAAMGLQFNLHTWAIPRLPITFTDNFIALFFTSLCCTKVSLCVCLKHA